MTAQPRAIALLLPQGRSAVPRSIVGVVKSFPFLDAKSAETNLSSFLVFADAVDL